MTLFLLFLTPNFTVEAAVTDRPTSQLIGSIETDTTGMMQAIETAQQSVDATLLLLDQKRRKIENDSMQISKNVVASDDKKDLSN